MLRISVDHMIPPTGIRGLSIYDLTFEELEMLQQFGLERIESLRNSPLVTNPHRLIKACELVAKIEEAKRDYAIARERFDASFEGNVNKFPDLMKPEFSVKEDAEAAIKAWEGWCPYHSVRAAILNWHRENQLPVTWDEATEIRESQQDDDDPSQTMVPSEDMPDDDMTQRMIESAAPSSAVAEHAQYAPPDYEIPEASVEYPDPEAQNGAAEAMQDRDA